MKLAPNIYTRKLSFEEAEKEQENMLKKIEELEKRGYTKSSRLSNDNRRI